MLNDVRKTMLGHNKVDSPSCHGAITVLDLPDELLVAVCGLLGPHDVLNMRQASCCSRFYLVTQDEALWIDVAARLSHSLPLPSLARVRTSTLAELERTSVQAVHVRKRWLDARKTPPRKIDVLNKGPHQTYLIDYLKIFRDRFAVVIYAPAVLLLDLDGLQFHGNEGQHSWGRVIGRWTSEGVITLKSCKSRFRESTEEVFVSFLVDSPNDECHLTVLSISTSGNPAQARPFQQVASIVIEGDVIRHDLPLTSLNPETSYVAHCSPRYEAISLLNWQDGFSKSLTIPHRTFDEEYAGDHMICLEVLESYVVAVKQHHLEIYSLPNSEDRESSAEISTRVEIVNPSDRSFYTASLTHRDISAESLTFVLALSDMFHVVSYYSLRLPRYPLNPDTLFSCQRTLLYVDQSLANRNVFVSSDISLGSRGMRTVWIEKLRDRMTRGIVALMVENTEAMEVSTGEVFTMSSANFKDDPTHITCDEVTGRIVLATRGGQLWILDCWRSTSVEREPLTRFQKPE